MTEKMWSSPTKPLAELLYDSDLLDQKIDNIPWMEETRRELESTLLSDKYKYSPQIPIIKECFKEAFWDYTQFIRFVNRFMFEIEDLIDSNNSLKWVDKEKEAEKYNKLKTKYDTSRSVLSTYFTEYGREMYDKLEIDNPWKSFEQVMDMGIAMEWKFFELILQRVQYIPSKQD